MITFRDFQEFDIEAIAKIHRKYPDIGVPSLNGVVANSTIESDGRIVGYGVVKNFLEGILILDRESLTLKQRAEVVRGAMRIAIAASELAKSDSLCITTPFEGFADILRKQYGFKDSPYPYLILDLRQ